MSIAAALRVIVAPHLDGLDDVARGPAPQLLSAYAAVGRRVGKASVPVPGLQVGQLGLDELVRMWLLLAAAEGRSDAEMLELVTQAYRRGDNRERHAVLRALPWLPHAEQYVPLAVDACRSSVQTIFEALACENAFPAAHFPDAAFNQLVLKAMFNGVALARIIGLDARVGSELQRMALDYAAERRAAGRTIPPDITLITGGAT